MASYPSPRPPSARGGRQGAALALALSSALSTSACDRVIDLLPGDDLALASDDGGGPKPDLLVPDLAEAPDLSVHGPIHFGDERDPARCAASLATTLHRQALCTCNRLQPQGALWTSAIDSSGAAVDANRFASVASNGSVSLSQASTIAGSLFIAQTLTVSHESTVRQVLRADGDLRLFEDLHVGGDVWVGGAISGGGNLSGNDTFHLTAQGALPPPDDLRDGGVDPRHVVRDFVAAGPQCNCNPSFLAIPSLVTAAATQNDDALAGLKPGDLANLTRATTIDLPSGRFYLSALSATAGLTLKVHGPAALFVDGGLTVSDLAVLLDAGAALDLVFTGALTSSGSLLGSDDAMEQPARVRLWTSTSGSLSFTHQATVSAALYAPAATLAAPSGLDLHGAALVGDVSLTGGTLHVAYDRALNSVGAVCNVTANPL